jgi:hypothetical protein
LGLIPLVSCGILKNEKVPEGTFAVQLHCTVHHPYCGGAKPNPDVAKGYYESMKFEEFDLFKGTSYKHGNKSILNVKLDEGGNITLNLEPGDYYLLHSDKLLSTQDFMNKNKPANDVHYVVKDTKCFEDWMKTPDLVFSVHADTIIELRGKAKCWVGTNPCIEYTGPPAP